MFRPTCLVYAASLALVGCNFSDKEEAQHDDSSNPHYKQAQEDIDNNNPNAAVADYQAALGENPKLPGAHYSLGLIYGDKLNDPVGSIYHFKRFLELAPNSDKAEQVKTLIDKESQAFAASLPNSPAQSANDYAQLQSENATLKKQVNDATRTIAKLQTQLAQAAKHHGRAALQAANDNPPSGPATPIVPVSTDTDASTDTNAAPAGPMRATAVDTNSPDVNTPPPVAPGATNAAAASSTPSRSYTVVKGDSVWKIAKKMYPGDTKNGEDKILGANQGLDPKKLKIGQVLVVP
jgi:Tfp pilus assembly protein FimV